MIEVGPYTFTERDATSTLDLVDALLDLYPVDAHPHLAPLKAELAQVAAEQSLHDAISLVFPRLLSDARQAAIEADTLSPTSTGTVAQLNVSDGGVPKQPVDQVDIDHQGVTSDRQGNRKHHGRPFQALCLWSTEIIEQLRDDGHPIFAGASGENITISGLDWTSLTMGTRLDIGNATAQVTAYAVPCGHQAQWFTDRDFSRLHHNKGKISRLYATVITPGSVTVGDQVTVEPSQSV